MDELALVNKVINEIERVKYLSHDPYDILGSRPIVFLRQRRSSALTAITSKTPSRKQQIARKFIAPVYQSSTFMSLYRALLGIPPSQHPKTMGLMLQAYGALHRALGLRQYLDGARLCAEWLITNADQLGFGHYCWGLPWEWPSDVTIPRHGPQATISTVNGLGLLDLYEITGDEKYFDVARSVCEFFLKDLYLDRVRSNAWAFSYTPYDRTHIVNVNFHCAALLARVWKICRDEDYLATVHNVCNFSIAEQRPDGAWHYSARVDCFLNAVDNTHTGDNLEYLAIIREALAPDFPYETEFRKGIDYYLTHFLSPEGMPYYTDTEAYPAESHSACQMLITLAALAHIDNRARPMADRLLSWIMRYLMNRQQNRMYYRLYETGRTDTSYSISWGDAWLAKALAMLIELDKKYEHSDYQPGISTLERGLHAPDGAQRGSAVE